jgi:hypothetical protein
MYIAPLAADIHACGLGLPLYGPKPIPKGTIFLLKLSRNVV